MIVGLAISYLVIGAATLVPLIAAMIIDGNQWLLYFSVPYMFSMVYSNFAYAAILEVTRTCPLSPQSQLRNALELNRALLIPFIIAKAVHTVLNYNDPNWWSIALSFLVIMINFHQIRLAKYWRCM